VKPRKPKNLTPAYFNLLLTWSVACALGVLDHKAIAEVPTKATQQSFLELSLQRRDSSTGETTITKEKVDPAKVGIVAKLPPRAWPRWCRA
jgi:hypothetical protein